MPKLLLPLLALVAIGGSAAAGGVYLATRGETVEEVPRPNADLQTAASPTAQPDQPPAKGQLWRWVNVTLVVPEGSPVTIGRGTVPTEVRPEGGPGMGPTIDHGGDPAAASYVIIDAVTGEILQDRVAPSDRAAIDEVLRTLDVSRFDETDKGWPYRDELPVAGERRVWGGMSYVVPDPASGVNVGGGINDPGAPFIEVSNGRSKIGISLDAETGALSRYSVALSPQDEVPFDRYVSAIQICGRDAQC